VVQSYRHIEPDGSHFEGHGVFTADPDRRDVFWYYVDSAGVTHDPPSRCTWHEGVLRVERRAPSGWTRHTITISDSVLFHVTELRAPLPNPAGDRAGVDPDVGANGKRPAFIPFMTSTFKRT
jgi:hypothetical protein